MDSISHRCRPVRNPLQPATRPLERALAVLMGTAVYTLLVRAALMGGLSLFTRQVGRRQQGLNSLAFVAALMALFTPLIL